MNTSLMISGVKPFLDFKFVPEITPLYYLMVIYYITSVIYGHIILYRNINNNTRNKFIFYLFIIGFLGGTTTMFPYLGIPVYPIGNFLVAFYAILTTYAIIKHRFFDASMAFTLGLSKILAIASLAIAYFYLYNLYLLIINIDNPITKGAFHIIYFIASCEAYQFLVEKFYNAQHKFLKKSYKRDEILEKLNKELSNSIVLKDLIEALK